MDRATRYFIDDASGILVCFNPATGDGQFDYATGQWGPDEFQTASQHIMRGGYLTAVTAEQAAGLQSKSDALDLLASLDHNRPYLQAEDGPSDGLR